MNIPRLIVLLGDSLLIDSVEAGLSDYPDIGLMRIRPGVPNLKGRLQALNPDLIIFDWDIALCHLLMPLLKDRPGLPMLGLDITCSRAILVSSQQYTVSTAHQLIELIQLQTNPAIMVNSAGYISFN